ncbi:MAG: Iodothyronine deiodinase [Planctomycetaceae bacterium]|nr:Iodothyronine deiodinase [Planctomycetaceae bacterium]
MPSTQPQFPLTPELMSVPLEEIEQAYAGQTPPEAIRMYLAISRGLPMATGHDWYGPGQSRYSWNWLAERHGVATDAGIPLEKFLGEPAWFQRLDRNRDGQITADDLDWSSNSSWVQSAYTANRFFRRMDPNGDGRISRADWLAYFDSVAQGQDEINSEQLREAWLAGLSSGYLPGDAPTKERLLDGFFSRDIGSMEEGPDLDAPAPDFTLQTTGGQQTVRLSAEVGAQPIALVFGNFTCGPFRSMYPGADDVAKRFHKHAKFFGIYVREAHPTDAWQMRSNDIVGVVAAQPKTYAERQAVAGQCHRLLAPSMPWLVDDINDSTGNAYSGMPTRCYVIDTAGRVAYKGGRGPFGFKTGEMEQSFLMTLLDQKLASE